MALRLLASFPVAVLLLAVLFGSASSYVSAVETSHSSNGSPPIRLERFESACEGMYRKIQEISRSATTCDLDLQCLGSPILCPITLDGNQERKYLKLRAEFGEQCDASYSLTDHSGDGLLIGLATCGVPSGGEELNGRNRAIEPAEPMTYEF